MFGGRTGEWFEDDDGAVDAVDGGADAFEGAGDVLAGEAKLFGRDEDGVRIAKGVDDAVDGGVEGVGLVEFLRVDEVAVEDVIDFVEQGVAGFASVEGCELLPSRAGAARISPSRALRTNW